MFPPLTKSVARWSCVIPRKELRALLGRDLIARKNLRGTLLFVCSSRVPHMPKTKKKALASDASFAERAARGRACRDSVSRATQGAWKAPPNRIDPARAVAAADRGRLPDLIPLKMGRMAESPFSFFRGSATLMAADLASLPYTDLPVQLCGDAHVRNLGAFAAPDGRLVFDINDFDETIPGPWEWDVKRLATSIVLAGLEAGDRRKEATEAVKVFSASYRESLQVFSRMRVTELARYEIRRSPRYSAVRSVLVKAERATPLRALGKLTEATPDKTPRFHDNMPLLRHVPDETAEKVIASIKEYRETLNAGRRLVLDGYRPVDVAFKVVGTGSIGTRDYVVLLFGNSVRDPLFLQFKEELFSCYVPYLPGASAFAHQGRRVAEGQQCMQTAATDPFLGWTTIEGRDFLVRQLSDHKAALDPAELRGSTLTEYALVCGEALAKAHARTGDAVALAAYCGISDKLDSAIATFGAAYAEQVARDFDVFIKAIKDGRIETAPIVA